MPTHAHRHHRSTFSTRALRALGAFGLTTADLASVEPARPAAQLAAIIDIRLGPGQIAFIAGPSGSGKSSILGALKRRRGAVLEVESPARVARFRARAVDVVGRGGGGGRSLDHALTLLATAGLADARLMVSRVADLSEGERARIALARAIEQAESARARIVTLIIDEFTASLDDATGMSVAASLARWARRPGSRTRIVAAGPRRAAARALKPDLLFTLPTDWIAGARAAA